MTEPTATPTTSRLRGPGALPVLIVGLASIALAVSAAVALSSTAAPDLVPASAVGPGPADADGFIGLAAATSTESAGGPRMPGMRRGGGGPFRAITLVGRNGNSLSLKTKDGWTRTITVDGDTTYSRPGVAITLNDLKPGDTLAFRQTKNSDSSFKINEIRVILPHVSGEVTAVSGSSITLRLRDGSSKTITVTGSTRYATGQAAAKAADVKVGVTIGAEGTASGDTFTTFAIQIRPAGAPNGEPGRPGGMRGHDGLQGPGGPGGRRGPAPSAGTAG